MKVYLHIQARCGTCGFTMMHGLDGRDLCCVQLDCSEFGVLYVTPTIELVRAALQPPSEVSENAG